MPKREVAESLLDAGGAVVAPTPNAVDLWQSAPDRDAPMVVILNPKSSFKSLLFNTFLATLAGRVARGTSTPLHLWEVETSARIGPLYKMDFRANLITEKAKAGDFDTERLSGRVGRELFLSRFLSVAQTTPCAIEFGSNYAERFWEDRSYCQNSGLLDAEFGPPERFIFLVPVTGEQDVVEGAVGMLSRIARYMAGARVLVFESDFKGPLDEVSPELLNLYRGELSRIANHKVVRVPKLPITLSGGTTGSRIDVMRENPASFCGAGNAIKILGDRVERRALTTDKRHELLESALRAQSLKRWLDDMWRVGEVIADTWDDACRDAGMTRAQQDTVDTA